MVQKSALRTILSGTPYSEALAKLKYDARRTFFSQKTVRIWRLLIQTPTVDQRNFTQIYMIFEINQIS